MDAKDCVFCGAIAQETMDIAFDDGELLVVFDKNPINPGHLLVIPRRHAPHLGALTTEEAARMMILAQRAEGIIRQVLGEDVEGTNLLMSNGAVADQSVFHAHLHVIPRCGGDGFEFVEDLTRYPVTPLAPQHVASFRELFEGV